MTQRKNSGQQNTLGSETPLISQTTEEQLISTEKRLSKNKKQAEIYQQQIQDMIDRDVARKLTQEELQKYKGPAHYTSHHKVLKADSKSTPVRIVFKSSAHYMGHVLNEYWAKGPILL